MSDDRAGDIAKDGWVSFSDILLTVVCALLFIRTLTGSREQAAAKARQFEDRLQTIEREAREIGDTAKAALLDVKKLAPAVGGQTRDGQTQIE